MGEEKALRYSAVTFNGDLPNSKIGIIVFGLFLILFNMSQTANADVSTKEDVNVNNLSIKKDKVNNIIATYTKENPIQETQLPKVIDGILSTLPKK